MIRKYKTSEIGIDSIYNFKLHLMKQKISTNKFKSLLVTAFVLLLGQAVWAYDIVSYGLTANLTSTSADISANAGKTFIGSAGAISFLPGNVAQNSGWNVANQYWQTAPFSTVGYHTIGISASMRSDNNAGPRDFNLEYSIDNGTSWHLVNSFTVNSLLVPKTGTLPQECQNQSSVIVRWINTSNSAVGTGTVTAIGKSYIKTVSIGGLLPVVPATQAHDLTVVSRTPTTITVGWTKGVQADSVVVMMNTINNFAPLPVDNQNFTAITGTYTSGRQVIYVGTKSTFTVNVPSATDQYYFRAFDFQTNNGMSRYILTSSDPGNGGVILNPILCDLEVITLNASTFRLTRATLGATIQAPKKSTIYEKGIFWSYSPGVSEADNPLQDFNDLDGSFSFPNEVIGRAVTIYYKGYATNESGTIWTAEATLNNSPVFSGSGTWETAALWNVQEVPGANGDATYGSILDSPTINGTCRLTADNSVTNLTVNSTKKLTLNAETTLTVAGTLANNATTSGLVVGAGNGTTANASLIFSNKALNQNVPASVEMYSKASTVGGNHWQYFGVPVQSQTVGTTFGGSERVRRFNEANFDPTGNDYGLWYPYPVSTMAAGETLSPVVGYEVVQASAKTYTFKGNLNATDFNYPLAYTTVPQLADYAGQNIIANPFTAAINISGLGFGAAEATAYLYNTGSREEWTSNDGETTAGVNPGTYIAVPSALAGSLGIPSQIPSMQGFLVKTLEPTSISIPYSSVVTNTVAQRAPALDQKVATMIDVIGSKSSDRMWIFSLPNCTRNFDNGYDGRKILGYNTQIFAIEGTQDYQIDAVNDINNTILGFQAGSETNFKLKFIHQNLENKYSTVYLTDMVENKIIDITASGTEYAFSAVPSTTPVNRFKITTSTTDNVAPDAGEQIKIFSSSRNAIIQNNSNAQGNIYIYSTSGLLVRSMPFGANQVLTISNLKAGAYIVKAKPTTGNDVNSYLIIR